MADACAKPTHKMSAFDELADNYMQKLVELDPILATYEGLTEFNGQLPDLSPAGESAVTELSASTLKKLDELTAKTPAENRDLCDELTISALKERLGLRLELSAAGETLAPLNVIASPLQTVRDAFDLMPTDTAENWESIASRLRAVPTALAGYQESLRLLKDGKIPAPAIRQVECCIKQCEDATAEGNPFAKLVASASENDNLPTDLRASLTEAAKVAAAAYGELGKMLASEIAPLATSVDAVGRDRYALFSRDFLGCTVDLEETYDWGAQILAETIAEQEAVAAQLYGKGTSVSEALERLNSDPDYTLHGTDTLQKWMQGKADGAVKALNGTAFDLPPEIQKIDCKIAPSGTGGIYYTGPSSDFTRAGAMWWAVPEGTEDFATWSELTTVYHEGVPGHHLQLGLATYNQKELNWFRRSGCWVSGYGEGWALYAERLMDEFGFLDHPAYRMGMLDGQRLRAARVVLDIGVHLGLQMHSSYGSGKWDGEKAWTFLREQVAMDPAFLRFELDRYLGWPGQAPSYKVGQRMWEQEREYAKEQAAKQGREFNLKSWHMQMLNQGALPLSVLRQANH